MREQVVETDLLVENRGRRLEDGESWGITGMDEGEIVSFYKLGGGCTPCDVRIQYLYFIVRLKHFLATGLFYQEVSEVLFFSDLSIYFYFDRTKATTKGAVDQLSLCNTFTL